MSGPQRSQRGHLINRRGEWCPRGRHMCPSEGQEAVLGRPSTCQGLQVGTDGKWVSCPQESQSPSGLCVHPLRGGQALGTENPGRANLPNIVEGHHPEVSQLDSGFRPLVCSPEAGRTPALSWGLWALGQHSDVAGVLDITPETGQAERAADGREARRWPLHTQRERVGQK